jgi:hypothetical protein
MGIKVLASKFLASRIVKRSQKWMQNPEESQKASLRELIKLGANTSFGKDHGFDQINDHKEFQNAVPIRDYEALKPYIDKMLAGEQNILWPGKPLYWSKTSGTTSGAKYIPISKESIGHHIRAARNALLFYIHRTGNATFLDGKMIFLQGSPSLEKMNGVNVGRLSGIVAHHVPSYLQKNRMPTWETNCIEDWEEKVDSIVEETRSEDMRLISGIPSWVQMYFEQLLYKTGKATVKELFPNFSLFVFGGLNFEPYRPIFKKLIGEDIDTIETYPASEGFIAFQDADPSDGLLLNLDANIFYEFIPLSEIHSEKPARLALWEVEEGVNYAIILNTNAGLWSYMIGDTVRFVSTKPYRLVVTGRTKHFISAFGEHVIAEEVEKAIKSAMDMTQSVVTEFHLAPQVNPEEGLPYHEWFVEFSTKPDDLEAFAAQLDRSLQEQNPYYRDLITGNILRPALLRICRSGSFVEYMKSVGRLGGQNKIPRLADNRKIADMLLSIGQIDTQA